MLDFTTAADNAYLHKVFEDFTIRKQREHLSLQKIIAIQDNSATSSLNDAGVGLLSKGAILPGHTKGPVRAAGSLPLARKAMEIGAETEYVTVAEEESDFFVLNLYKMVSEVIEATIERNGGIDIWKV